MVIGVPMKPDEGVTLSSEMDGLGVEAAAIGPGSAATPWSAGGVRTMGVVAVATTVAGTFLIFLTTGALALCLCTVAELALETITTVEQSSAALVTPTTSTLIRDDFKRLFMAFPSDCDIDN
jgi:hypothetical protein